MLNFDLANVMPGIDALTYTYDAGITWGRRESIWPISAPILSSAVDAGNSSTTNLRGGLLLGKVTATSKLKEWNPTGTDGSEYIYGVLAFDQMMLANSVARDRWVGHILPFGCVRADKLIIPGNASAGINGDNYEMLVRQQMAGRFTFDDDMWSHQGAWRNYITKTADFTCLESQNNCLFDNLGASGTVVFTLPTARPGLRFGFMGAADQILRVVGTPVDSIIAPNDLAADRVSLETATEMIGGMLEFIARSTTVWFCIPHLYETQTPTVTS